MAVNKMKKYQPWNFAFWSAFACSAFNAAFMADHPDYFFPEGTTVFCGSQGSGKTISAVRMVLEIIKRFPKCTVCSNIDFKYVPDGQKEPVSGLKNHKGIYVPYNDLEQLIELQNGYEGVLYVIDEMHLQFNSLQSKNMPLEVFQEVSQQRKQRKCIIGTSQVYMRLAKPFREQISNVVICDTIFKYLQRNAFIDGNTAVETPEGLEAVCYGTRYFFHSPALYNSYDTFAKVKAGQGFQAQSYYSGFSGAVPDVVAKPAAGRRTRFRNFG